MAKDGFAYSGVSTATTTTALAVEQGYRSDNYSEKNRAVRIDLTDGHVVELIATPAAGRRVLAISGGSAGLVYTTTTSNIGDDLDDIRHYLQFADQDHGLPLLDLAAHTNAVYAQP